MLPEKLIGYLTIANFIGGTIGWPHKQGITV